MLRDWLLGGEEKEGSGFGVRTEEVEIPRRGLGRIQPERATAI